MRNKGENKRYIALILVLSLVVACFAMPAYAEETPGPSSEPSLAPSAEPTNTLGPSGEPGATESIIPTGETPMPTGETPAPTGETQGPASETPTGEIPTETPTETPTPTPTPSPTPDPTRPPDISSEINDYTLKVGLKYSSTSQEKADFTSASGGSVGIQIDKTFINLANFSASEKIKVRKDTYYHIKLYGGIDSIEDAYIEMVRLRTLLSGYGRTPFIASGSDGKWIICVGLLTDTNESLDSLNARLNGTKYVASYIASQVDAVLVIVGDDPIVSFITTERTSTIRIKPASDTKGSGLPPLVTYGNARYRGYIDVRRYNNGNLVIINEVGAEDYLYGVVPAEMIAGSPSQYSFLKEGLKAQAIMARTMAYIYTSRTLNSYGFHVDNTTNYQVYNGYTREDGVSGETENTNRAVDETRDLVMIYNNKLAPEVYYSGNDGGYTEVPQTVWNGTGASYLSTRIDVFTPLYLRSKTYSGYDTALMLGNYIKNQSGLGVGTVSYINVTSRAQSGRVLEILVEGTAANAVITKQKARTALDLIGQFFWFEVDTHIEIDYQKDGNRKALSEMARKYLEGQYFTKSIVGSNYAVIGDDGYNYERIKIYGTGANQTIVLHTNGHGHGVGVSQDGMSAMSRMGYTAQEILQFYLDGITIDTWVV